MFIPGFALVLAIFTISNSCFKLSEASSCNIHHDKEDPNKIICVCNQLFCDEFIFDWPQEKGQTNVITSSIDGQRFDVVDLAYVKLPYHNVSTTNIYVNLTKEHQTILGWGGAFTDATGYNLHNLSAELADKILESYYGETGLQYNFGRVPIGSSDFSTHTYSYDDHDGDYDLKKWSLAQEDIQYKIPFIKKAIDIAQRQGTTLKLFASPWTPPKWMKTNKNFVRGHLIDDEKVLRSYADYLVKFFKSYEKEGIKFWGATVQNEPLSSFLPIYYFNSLQFGSRQMAKFISRYLGPALEAEGMTKDNFKLIVGDDSLGFINLQVPYLLNDRKVRKYVSGMAFHWYTSGSIVPYDMLRIAYDSVKDKIEFMIMSEACMGSVVGDKHVDLGSWHRGETYASDIIEDLIRETGAWIDWNMALDQQGGPNWAKNFVDSPIIVNTRLGEFYKQPMYYALGHFSRFFKPGSIRIETTTDDDHLMWNLIKFAAVHNNATGHLTVNILNRSNDPRKINIFIKDTNDSHGKIGTKTLIVQAKSINSVVIKL